MILNHYFLDASYIIALELVDDQNHKKAIQHWHHVNEQIFLEGWNLLQKYNDKSYSLTDCIINC